MALFNKGDFTQLGVAGHVNANLRLNEKRLVNIDMTSNENAEGCTIVGTVKDLLNNKVYNIGSAPSGNIEITENGENINVAAYATATVNVSGGGGNIPLCTLTVIAPPGTDGTSTGGWVAFVDNILQQPIFSEGSNTALLPYMDDEGATLFGMAFADNAEFVFSNPVNIDLEENDWPYIIDETQNSSLTVTVTSWGGSL